MASTNPDSMTNAQGEFHPSRPRDEPLQTSGHQVGQLVGNDAAPEFHAKVLPPGSAPKESTYQPNPINEVPGQANNPDVERAHGKEGVKSAALDMPGATSGDVHQGLGHPGAGQSSAEIRHEGKSHRAKDRTGLEGVEGALGGSGLTGEESQEAKRLQEEHTRTGPASAQEHNTSLAGAEGKEPVAAEQLASEDRNVMQGDYLRRGEKGSGNVQTKQ